MTEPTTSSAVPTAPLTARDRLYLLAASALGLGLSPIAPGTCGALLGVLFHVGTVLILPSWMHAVTIGAGLAVTCILNHVLTPWAQEYWNDPDPRHFVLDEIAGYLVVALLFPYGPLWHVAVVGFLLFRVFDVIKIPPAWQIDRDMHGSWGIVLDDIVSGVYAALVLWVWRLLSL